MSTYRLIIYLTNPHLPIPLPLIYLPNQPPFVLPSLNLPVSNQNLHFSLPAILSKLRQTYNCKFLVPVGELPTLI